MSRQGTHFDLEYDIGVIERRHGARFHCEALAARRIAGHLRRQHLERYAAPQARIAGAIHLATSDEISMTPAM